MEAPFPSLGPQVGGPMWGSDFSGATTMVTIFLPLENCHTRGVGPDQTISLFRLPVSMWLIPYVLSCANSVQLVFIQVLLSDSYFIFSCIVFMCLQEEVSSGSARFALLSPETTFCFLNRNSSICKALGGYRKE